MSASLSSSWELGILKPNRRELHNGSNRAVWIAIQLGTQRNALRRLPILMSVGEDLDRSFGEAGPRKKSAG